MLGELEEDGTTVVFDMEAGAGTLLRMAENTADAALVIVEPSAKSIEAGRRLTRIAARQRRVLVVANKIRASDELDAIEEAFAELEIVAVPFDEAIERADREGRAPIDVDPDGPGGAALRQLADRLGV